MEKNWTITFYVEQLAAAHAWQSTTVDASDLGLAIKRAWAIVKKRPAVKGRRVKSGSVKFTLNEGMKGEE